MSVVIPRGILQALGLQLGDNVALAVEDGRMLMRRLSNEELMGPRTETQAADVFAARGK